MKKTAGLFLAFVMFCCAIAGTEISAFASTDVNKALTVQSGKSYSIKTNYDNSKEYKLAHSWVKFKPSKTGAYILWTLADNDDDFIIPVVYTGLAAAKANDESKIIYQDGFVSDSANEKRSGVVVSLTGDKTYYIDICAVNLEGYKSEPVVEFGIRNHTHTYESYKYSAGYEYDGETGKVCNKCGAKKSVKAIPKVKTVNLSSTSYTYNGKTHKPTVTVKDRTGKALVEGTDYTLTYQSGRKSVGKYTVTVKFKGNYEGSVKKTFTVKPKSTSIASVSASKKAFTVKWKKQSSQTNGYQVQYSNSSSFKNAKSLTVSNTGTTSKKITGLAGNKKYYVRVRTYKTVNGNKIYSSWSNAKTVTTKK